MGVAGGSPGSLRFGVVGLFFGVQALGGKPSAPFGRINRHFGLRGVPVYPFKAGGEG